MTKVNHLPFLGSRSSHSMPTDTLTGSTQTNSLSTHPSSNALSKYHLTKHFKSPKYTIQGKITLYPCNVVKSHMFSLKNFNYEIHHPTIENFKQLTSQSSHFLKKTILHLNK